ncbi:histidine phosphatase family protein [Terrisporobacter mayombei]|uniref:phosphoglycerate mutase (2,3-diphosphoglycerate-dependent) n=1 Tax=Terrisporobacter mayombei TaxID=1541 RepID=A0ABY9Q3Z7_9FIRM|nr:histidine phosphatase family protein [Terrisporobacter mayombei]MCC3869137.1 histidine phosphatase family protein [Terrisporobacter mayombei]WMT82728.1 Phosphoserine phosphatase 1 [Terrisporobacter mayombei]
MIKLILVRHGITVCNEVGDLSGLTDSILSEKGKLQANKIAEYLKYEVIDKIYTTPFSRTKDTIKKLAEVKNIQAKETCQLNEINFGDFEGLSFKVIEEKYPEEVERMIKEGFEYKYPNGESSKDTFIRVKNEMSKIINSNDNSTVLICSHGGTIRNIISYLLCDDYKYHWNFKIDNGSITEIEVDNNFAVINKLNDTSYMNL